jgi:ribonuclease HI
MEKITVHFDGSCEPTNPGGNMGFGATIKNVSGHLHRQNEFISASPKNSNNVAEYLAVCIGLQWLVDNGFEHHEIEICGDSMLVINQLAGTWRVKGGLYYDAYKRAETLRDKFTNISFKWIPRDQNAEADQLSRSSTMAQ